MHTFRKLPTLHRLSLVIILILSGCTEVIDLNVTEEETLLVFYGKVTDGLAGNELRIARTSSFGREQVPVFGATPILLEDGIPIGKYEELREPGLYRLNLEGDSARVGREYQLQVTLLDGREYRSAPAIMPDLAAIDRPYFDATVVEVTVNQAGLEVSRNLIQLFIDTEIIDNEKEFYLKWNTFEAYSFEERLRVQVPPVLPPPCYIINNDSGQDLYLFNGADIKVSEIKGLLLSSSEIDSRFAFDYYFSIVQSTMDRNTYEYWRQVDEVSNTFGSIFDQPPAPVPGNISNVNDPAERVLGYFEVVRSDTTRVRVRGDAIPFYVSKPCPAIPPGTNEPPECTDCIIIKNSTYQRPYYWF